MARLTDEELTAMRAAAFPCHVCDLPAQMRRVLDEIDALRAELAAAAAREVVLSERMEALERYWSSACAVDAAKTVHFVSGGREAIRRVIDATSAMHEAAAVLRALDGASQ